MLFRQLMIHFECLKQISEQNVVVCVALLTLNCVKNHNLSLGQKCSKYLTSFLSVLRNFFFVLVESNISHW